jgi:ligand-binding sensor protein/putative methionine-R-sulfoxide reductase with GAF domain
MKFDELIDVKHWQNIQDLFSSIIGVSLRTVDQNGEIIVRPSNIPVICAEPVADSPFARKKCWQWYPKLAAHLNKQPAGRWSENICPLGLANCAMPIVFNNTETVYMVAGPLVFENSPKDIRLTERMQEAGVDEQRFFEGFNLLPALGTADIERITEFLGSITVFMASLETHGKNSGDGCFVFEKENIGSLLKVFLEVAMKLCQAERGSVMVFEKKTQELLIKDAMGLSDEVIQTTKLKPGEGLAGITIARRKALFLNDQLSDRELRLRMNKPKIKSAFVIPVFYKNDILGVISVCTAKKPNNFSDKLMELLNELVGMALEKITLK